MSRNQQGKQCNCSSPDRNIRSAVPPASKPIKTIIPQNTTLSINFNVMRGKNELLDMVNNSSECKPRGNRQPRPWLSGLDIVSESMRDLLLSSERTVIDWLEKDIGNSELFFEDPATALVKAGVKLTRSQQKELSRSFNTARSELLLAPGMQLGKLTMGTSSTNKRGSFRTNANRAEINGRVVKAPETRQED